MYGDLYASSAGSWNDWLKQQEEANLGANPYSANGISPEQQTPEQDYINAVGSQEQPMGDITENNSQAQDTTMGAIEGVAGKYGPVGMVVAGVIGAANENLKTHKPGETGNLNEGFQQGVKSGVKGYIANQALESMGADVAAETAGTASESQLGDIYTAGNKYADITPGIQRAASETDMIDKAGNFAKSQLHGKSGGILYGDYSPNESSGSFGYDLVKGLSDGGGLDKGIGNIRGGNYGGAIGQGMNYTINNYRPPHYDAEEYKKKNKYA